jgi:hypothetical protein
MEIISTFCRNDSRILRIIYIDERRFEILIE